MVNEIGLVRTEKRTEQTYLANIPRTGIWLQFMRTLEVTVRRSAFAQQIVTTQSIGQWTPTHLSFLQIPLEQLYHTQGQVRIQDLAIHCCLSLRQFERRFKQLLGVSPKFFARLLRFEAFRDSLIRERRRCQSDAAAQFGYQDQAHLIHEFKIWAGCTPGMFQAQIYKRWLLRGHLRPDPRTPPPFLWSENSQP